jgi:GNAT superfamily N-acetyltransferase
VQFGYEVAAAAAGARQTGYMSEVGVRQAVPRDGRALHRLGQATFTEWSGAFEGVAAVSAAVHRMQTSRWRFGVATDGNPGARGLYVTKPDSSTTRELTEGLWAELVFVAVDESCRGQGLGQRLVAAAIDDLRQAGFAGVIASVRSELRGWWSQQGWYVPPLLGVLWTPDIETLLTTGQFGWSTPVDSMHPYWVWRSCDPARPATAWVLPEGQTPPLDQLEAEARRQSSYIPIGAKRTAIRTVLNGIV